jgi:hypothetical protein
MSENPNEEETPLPFFQLAADNDQIPKLQKRISFAVDRKNSLIRFGR